MAAIFVTGGAGFIGSNFVRYWLAEYPDDTVVNYDALTYAGNSESLRGLVEQYGDRYRFIHGDIGNYDLLMHALRESRPTAIVNFAAESHNSRAVLDPKLFFRSNVLGTQRLLDAARDTEVPRFHHISTCEVYGDLGLDEDRAFSEDSPYRPKTPYSASKAGADLAVLAYKNTFDLPATISNCSNNYGPHQFPEKVIPTFAIKALLGKPLPLYASSMHKREWLHVEDHCRAIELILRAGRIGQTYNIGSGVELTVEQIADLVIDTVGSDSARKLQVPDRPGHDRRYLLDSSKIRTELGWAPKISADQGIRETICWYRDNPWWWEPLLAKAAVDEESWRAPGGSRPAS